MTDTIQGLGASQGIAIGRAFVVRRQPIPVDRSLLEPTAVEAEMQRFVRARAAAGEQLQEIRAQAAATLGEEQAELFDGHLELLFDDEIEEAVREAICAEHRRAICAVTEVMEQQARELEALDNAYMQERAADLREIGDRVVHCLAGRTKSSLRDIGEASVVVADELGPAETAQMDLDNVLALVVERGGKTSHVAIMARSLGIPAMVGAVGAVGAAEHGEVVVVDASDGDAARLLVRPGREQLAACQQKVRSLVAAERELGRLRDLPSVTTDGHHVELCANVASAAEASRAALLGAEGVGLLRSEFLFMGRQRAPSVHEQVRGYLSIGEAVGGRPMVIRTLDIGGDKPVPYVEFPAEDNPFLGWRGIRMCLDRPEVLEEQLRALLLASSETPVRVMVPMVVSVEEVRRVKSMIEAVKEELKGAGHAFDDTVQVGIMVETPAAALIAPWLAEEVDFFSVGSNDLTQYTLAVDRGNEAISDLYQPLHPALLKLYQQVVEATHQHEGKWVGICGELAADEAAVPLLVGLGFDELSMAPTSIPRVKRKVRELSVASARSLAAQALQCRTTAEVVKLLRRFDSERREASDRGSGMGAGPSTVQVAAGRATQ